MKEELCRAFCSNLHVERVPAGWAVQTPYRLPDGDPVMFFIVTVDEHRARLEDDGATVAMLEASGVSLDVKGARYRAFQDILAQHGASFDDDEGLIMSAALPSSEIPGASIKFTALMLRVHDLALLSSERVQQSWRDDAIKALHQRFDPVAAVAEGEPLSPRAGGLTADVVIRPSGAPPVAVILGTSNAKGLHALVLKMELEKYQGQDSPVLLLVERAKDNPLSESTYALAQSRLNGVHTFRGAELEALGAVSRYVPEAASLH